MTFLTLNDRPIPCRTNACDVKDARHRQDMARMFTGDMRVTGGAVFREFTVVTGFLDATDYAAVRALVNSTTLPLTADGDWIGDGPISVIPVPGSFTPIATKAEATGFRRQAKFTLHETITVLAPDTSATPWAFYRRGVGFWQDRAGTIAAVDGDKVDRWDDQTGNARHLLSHDGGVSGLDGVAWAGALDYRPYRDVSQNAIKLGFSDNIEGWTEMRPPRMDTLNEMEILVGVRAYADPDVGNLSLFKWRSGVNGDYYPDNTGHIQISFGLASQHDAGDPTVDLAGFNCLDISGSNFTNELVARLNDDTILTYDIVVGSEVFAWNQNAPTDGPGFFNGFGNFRGWARDVVIFDGLLTDTQRTAWKNYILGLTSIPPL